MKDEVYVVRFKPLKTVQYQRSLKRGEPPAKDHFNVWCSRCSSFVDPLGARTKATAVRHARKHWLSYHKDSDRLFRENFAEQLVATIP